MKNRFFIFFLLLIPVLLMGKGSVSFTVQKPAEVDIPGNIKTIVIVNRTMTENTRRNVTLNVLEGILTGEGVSTDNQGAQACMNKIFNGLNNSGLIKAVMATETLTGNQSANLPAMLSWEQVNEICRKYGADALIAIEAFDSDYITLDAKKESSTSDDGTTTTYYTIQGTAKVSAGFRFYDLSTRTVADEYVFEHKDTWKAKGNTAMEAYGHLSDRKDAIMAVSRQAGNIYSKRIIPSWYRVTRTVYNKPKKLRPMQEGWRLSNVAKWEEAIKAWERAIPEAKKDKHAGWAAYNIGVAYEVLGQLKTAAEWASKSWVDFGWKDGKNYSDELRRRIREEESVRRQNEN